MKINLFILFVVEYPTISTEQSDNVKNSIETVIRQYAKEFDSESEDENNVSRDNAASDVIE